MVRLGEIYFLLFIFVIEVSYQVTGHLLENEIFYLYENVLHNIVV